ncbi:hypothetical protein DBV05_g5015 [Lasiodiplodia theobromae]|uniref:Peptidase A1 domain-containing protein n=1 Tax=Lasiodiplodia theobromae TaxID=45133 RepID=A0A5N5DF38_9PEZI|nr:hypothetical protein DBV05_g5015 [Lasiodiplodia theobromae]
MHVTRNPPAFDPAAKHNFGRRETQPAPVVVEPSQEWDGNDGPWSSFVLQVGTPPQQVRVDISIAGQETWVVSPGGCADAGTDCANNRGGEFNSQASSTWQSTTTIWKNSGIYQLAGLITNALGIDGVCITAERSIIHVNG